MMFVLRTTVAGVVVVVVHFDPSYFCHDAYQHSKKEGYIEVLRHEVDD